MHGICFLEATKSSVGKTTWLQVQVQVLQSSVATDRNYDPDQITGIKSTIPYKNLVDTTCRYEVYKISILKRT